MHLFHETSLAVTVGINLRVELVQQRGLVLTCSAVVSAACGVLKVVAVDLAVVVAVTNTAANNSSLGRRSGQVALANVATVSVGGVRVATGQVGGTNTAVVVAVKGVMGTGRGGAGLASQVLGANLAVVVAIERVVGTSGRVVGKTALPQTSIAVVVGGGIIVAVAGVLVAVGADSLMSKTGSSADTASATDVLGDTLELVVALLATGKSTALGLELLHGHGWESSSLMVGGLVMVNLMDRDGGVDNVGLDGLFLDNGLNSLVDVVVDVLSANSGGNTLAMGGVLDAALVGKTSLVINQSSLGGIGIAMVKLAVLNSTELSSMLLWENLTVMDRLDSAVVVVLVNLLVNGSVDLLMYVRLDDLVLNSGGNCLVDSGVVVTGAAHEVGDRCLGLVHFDCCVVVVV